MSIFIYKGVIKKQNLSYICHLCQKVLKKSAKSNRIQKTQRAIGCEMSRLFQIISTHLGMNDLDVLNEHNINQIYMYALSHSLNFLKFTSTFALEQQNNNSDFFIYYDRNKITKEEIYNTKRILQTDVFNFS